MLAILDSRDKIPHLSKYGDMYYNFWQDKAHPRGLWRRTTFEKYVAGGDVEWETVLDVDALGAAEGESWVYKGHSVLEEFGDDGAPLPPTRTMMALSPGGSDAVVRREFDLVEKRFVDGGFALPAAKSRVAWLDRDALLVGSDFGPGSLTDSGYPRDVRVWRRGEPLADAALAFRGKASDVSVSGYVAHHRGHSYEGARAR